MRIAFDMDLTITKFPVQCRELMKSLKLDGWEIYVLSPNPMEDLNQKIDKFEIREYLSGVINSGEKGKVCRNQRIDVYLDDWDDYLSQAVEMSPGTMSLKVL